MRYLVLTDIHANLEALDACLLDAAARDCGPLVVLGDLVGYGADPNAVVDRIRDLQPIAMVRGNHDKVATGLESAESFNHVARAAVTWTASALTPDNRRWVADLPQGPRPLDDAMLICHGSPVDEDEYIFGSLEAQSALAACPWPLCLFGHTHCQAVFELEGTTLSEVRLAAMPLTVRLEPSVKYLVNPGAVGQPRDADPRAAYAIVDTSRSHVELHRVVYPIHIAQEKIRRAGLPRALADRLALGR